MNRKPAMRTLTRTLLGLAVLASTGFQAADTPAKARVLLMTGDDVSPAHDWLSCATATREVLRESGRFDVDVIGGAEALANEANLENVDAIYLMLYNARTPTLSDRSKENLRNFVRGGKGLVFHHTFGHDVRAINTPEVKRLIVQGTAWAAGK